jgi:hypothetical protein
MKWIYSNRFLKAFIVLFFLNMGSASVWVQSLNAADSPLKGQHSTATSAASAPRSYLPCNPHHRNTIPVFFGPRSFCDPDVEAKSMLDCSDEIKNIYRKKVKAAERGDSTPVKDTTLWDKLVSFKSIFFNPCLEYFALYAKAGEEPLWRPIDLKLRLQFVAEEYCDGPSVMLKLTFEHADSSAQPILYAGLPKPLLPGDRREPRGYFTPQQVARSVRMLEPTETDPVNYEIITTFAVPCNETRIKHLVRYDARGYIRVHGDTLTVSSRLRAVMNSGDTIDVLKDEMFGFHEPENAFIGDPIMVDFNGDGFFDIVVESSGDRQVLGLQLPYGGIEFRYLRNRNMSGSGGC